MTRELVLTVFPDGRIALEWESCTAHHNSDRRNLEELIYDRYINTTAGRHAVWQIVLGISDLSIPLSPSLSFWRSFAGSWVRQVRTRPESEEQREKLRIDLDEFETFSFLERLPLMTGVEHITGEFLSNAWRTLHNIFAVSINGYKGSLEDWFNSLSPQVVHVDRIHFHLVENRKNQKRPFAFLATYTARIDEYGRTRHLPLAHALKEFGEDTKKLLALLATVHKVAKDNSLIAEFVDSGELFHPIALTPKEAFNFLNGVAAYEAAGILCRIPQWWRGGIKKAAVTLSIGNNKPSKIGFDALLDFSAAIHLDGQELSEAEARAILEQAEGLAFLKGRWVAVDGASLKTTLDMLAKAKTLAAKERISFAAAMRLLMGTQTTGSFLPGAQVDCGVWLRSVMEKMTNPALVRTAEPSPHLKAELRPYQRQGLNWLNFLHSLGFGICLADDMGLGKTVQVLALLQRITKKGDTSLIVAPASLLENWKREIEKFTPDINAVIIHPQIMNAASMNALCDDIGRYSVAITTYGMLNRCGWLAKHKWFYVICDEAQAIKNPGTKQTRAVKDLTASHRMVMTGTPVENRLSDLWSLFDFINPGLLGSFKQFKEFSKTLDSNPEGYGRLRRVVHPYILRRSKTDKSVIADLPDKIEMKTWCMLSKDQAVLYGNLVRQLEKELMTADGIKRKGIVLGYLTKCKQLCNHPDHFSGAGRFESSRSGKFERLAELCESIREKREKALVFTQFAEIIEPLSAYLDKIFGSQGVSLSGATTMKKRKEAIECFQSGSGYTPFFILSLKAGGVGLNLTAANHVIHFDRWWNPAVENQATDRAYRIGQNKNVVVHKFICKGTIEEKIDALIEDKKKLAGEVIPTAAENWITELDNSQLRDLFRLTIDAEKEE